jgi:hypothetical protein
MESVKDEQRDENTYTDKDRRREIKTYKQRERFTDSNADMRTDRQT